MPRLLRLTLLTARSPSTRLWHPHRLPLLRKRQWSGWTAVSVLDAGYASIWWNHCVEQGKESTFELVWNVLEDVQIFFGRIEKRATVRSTKQKGRCLFINEALNAARLCIFWTGFCPEIIRSLPFDDVLYHPSCFGHIDTLWGGTRWIFRW